MKVCRSQSWFLTPDRQLYHEYAVELRDKFNTGLLAELRPYPHFLVWQSVRQGERLQKIPYTPRTGLRADPTDPKEGSDVMTALRALATGRYNGMGFILTDTPFMAVDLDKCVHDNRQPSMTYCAALRPLQCHRRLL
jgi:hypothetical protein